MLGAWILLTRSPAAIFHMGSPRMPDELSRPRHMRHTIQSPFPGRVISSSIKIILIGQTLRWNDR